MEKVPKHAPPPPQPPPADPIYGEDIYVVASRSGRKIAKHGGDRLSIAFIAPCFPGFVSYCQWSGTAGMRFRLGLEVWTIDLLQEVECTT